jgi:hypothetical protein
MVIAVAVLVAVTVMVMPYVATAPPGGDMLGKMHATPVVAGTAPVVPVIGGMAEMPIPVTQSVRHHKSAGYSGAGDLDPDHITVVTEVGINAFPLQR